MTEQEESSDEDSLTTDRMKRSSIVRIFCNISLNFCLKLGSFAQRVLQDKDKRKVRKLRTGSKAKLTRERSCVRPRTEPYTDCRKKSLPQRFGACVDCIYSVIVVCRRNLLCIIVICAGKKIENYQKTRFIICMTTSSYKMLKKFQK